MLFISLIFTYIIHFGISNRDLVTNYIFNGIFTSAAFLLLYQLQKKRVETVGFSFMGVSAIKFTLFLIIFQPLGLPLELKRAIFLDFFIPYAVCMILEVYFLAKSLN